MSSNVREARPSDCQALANLMKESVKEQHISNAKRLTSSDLERQLFGHYPSFRIIVNESSNGSIDGYLLFVIGFSATGGKISFVGDIYVIPDHRRTGIATALWNTLIQIASADGCRRCDIYTKAPNKFLLKVGAHDSTNSSHGENVYEIQKDAMENLVEQQDFTLDFVVREATERDIPDIYENLKELYIYLGKINQVTANEKVLLRECFGKHPSCKSFVADKKGTIVGYTIFSYVYYLDGPAIFMEDLFVSSENRGQGIGTALWSAVLKEGLGRGVTRCNHAVAVQNKPASGYYKSKGAFDATETKNTHFFNFSFQKTG